MLTERQPDRRPMKVAVLCSQRAPGLLHLLNVDREHGRSLGLWLEGWSACLAEINYMKTGLRLQGLLDVQYLTDEDVRRGTGYASKIHAVTDAARPLRLKERPSS